MRVVPGRTRSDRPGTRAVASALGPGSLGGDMRLLAAVVVTGLVLLGGCGGAEGTAHRADGLTVFGLQTEQTLPTNRVDKLEFIDFDGSPGTFAEFAGRPLVVNFWASWCVPCIKEMPTFEQLHHELGGAVSFVGVNVVDQQADAARMVEQTGVTYRLVRDPKQSLLAWFGGTQMPTTAFVDANGKVAKVVTRSLRAEELRAEIEAIR